MKRIRKYILVSLIAMVKENTPEINEFLKGFGFELNKVNKKEEEVEDDK